MGESDLSDFHELRRGIHLPADSHIPKLRRQTNLLENLCDLFLASSMILQGQALPVPELGQFPNLLEGQRFAAFEMVSLAPCFDPFFRLEEKHGRSGENQVIVPAGEGQGEVDEVLEIGNLPVLDFQLNGLVAFGEHGFDDRVAVERGGDAEHVPGAVGKVCPAIGVDFEVRRDA
jgi:hypothetical protein